MNREQIDKALEVYNDEKIKLYKNIEEVRKKEMDLLKLRETVKD